MKLNYNKILLIISILLLLGFACSYYIFNKKENEWKRERAITKIKNDSLVKIKDGQYTKLLADTLTRVQLRKKIKELGIELENALLAQKLTLRARDTIKIIEEVNVTDTTLTFTDFYPKKENFFVKHITSLNIKDTTATGEFNFNPITISLAASEQSDGTYKIMTKLPEFFELTSLDIQSLPIEQRKEDKFGILFGVDYVKGLDIVENNIDFNTYIRIKKFYIGGGYRTDNTLKGGIKIEF